MSAYFCMGAGLLFWFLKTLNSACPDSNTLGHVHAFWTTCCRLQPCSHTWSALHSFQSRLNSSTGCSLFPKSSDYWSDNVGKSLDFCMLFLLTEGQVDLHQYDSLNAPSAWTYIHACPFLIDCRLIGQQWCIIKCWHVAGKLAQPRWEWPIPLLVWMCWVNGCKKEIVYRTNGRQEGTGSVARYCENVQEFSTVICTAMGTMAVSQWQPCTAGKQMWAEYEWSCCKSDIQLLHHLKQWMLVRNLRYPKQFPDQPHSITVARTCNAASHCLKHTTCRQKLLPWVLCVRHSRSMQNHSPGKASFVCGSFIPCRRKPSKWFHENIHCAIRLCTWNQHASHLIFFFFVFEFFSSSTFSSICLKKSSGQQKLSRVIVESRHAHNYSENVCGLWVHTHQQLSPTTIPYQNVKHNLLE